MIKYYCDICGTAIDKPEAQFRRKYGRLDVLIIRSIDGTWNSGQACWECVLLAIIDGD